MSIEDRDWYREDFKRRQAIGTQRQPVNPPIYQQPRKSSAPDLGAGAMLVFGLFLLAAIAVSSCFI